MMLRRGRPIAIPPTDKAVRFLESEGQALDAMPPGRRTVVGSPSTVAAGLREVAESYGAEELIVVSITHDHEARRRLSACGPSAPTPTRRRSAWPPARGWR